MTELNLDGKTEAEVRDAEPEPEVKVKAKGGRPKTNARRSEEERAKDRERYHRKAQAGRAAQQPQAVQSSLDRVLERLVERQEGRGDLELADALRQDGKMMASTTGRLVKLVPQLAGPLLIILGLVEPFLAFGRVAGILRRRVLDRRLAAAEAEAIIAEEAEQPTPPGVYQNPSPQGSVFADAH